MRIRRSLSAGVLVVTGLLLVSACSSEEPPPASTTGDIEGLQTFDGLSRDHTTDDVDYPQSPPVGGDHDPAWITCTGKVYDSVLRNENAVHSLEHGAVWLTYTDEVSEDDIAVLAGKIDGQPYSMMSPYPDQASPIMLTAWGVQLGVDSVDDPRIDEFLTTYRQGPQTPEPGATCESGEMPL